jgi:hypothetical protein
MNLTRVVVMVTLVACFVGCGTKHVAQNRLDETLAWYQRMVEKGDLEATVLLASDSIAGEYLERSRGAREARVIECRILRVDYSVTGEEADVSVEVEYYSLSTLKVKKTREMQKWVYTRDASSSRWRLMTVPSFFN